MHLTRVVVKNHSRLADTDIEVRSHLILVGPNDVGKSSLLRCLDLLLGANTAQMHNRVTGDDFREAAQPFIIEATITDLDADDQAAFPDEPTVDPATNELTLTLSLEATIEDSDGTIAINRTAPNSGNERQVSRQQIEQLGWNLLSATAMSRELREDRRSAVQDILQQVDLGAEQASFETLIGQIQDALTTSAVLDGIRGSLSAQLSKALPVEVGKDELKFETGAMADGDVLAGVRLRVERDGKVKDLKEQSDGIRALYAIALYDLVSTSAHMVAVDEPEIHLHPTSQRSLARLLRDGKNQRLLATHSPDIVSAFPADSIVSVRPGGISVQPDAGFLSDDEKMVVHWWVRDKLEPLTANGVIGVEGISDRILIERISDLTDRNLDRLGISLVETRGSGNMPAIIKLFGPSGFQIPLSILIDEDARRETADVLGVWTQPTSSSTECSCPNPTSRASTSRRLVTKRPGTSSRSPACSQPTSSEAGRLPDRVEPGPPKMSAGSASGIRCTPPWPSNEPSTAQPLRRSRAGAPSCTRSRSRDHPQRQPETRPRS